MSERRCGVVWPCWPVGRADLWLMPDDGDLSSAHDEDDSIDSAEQCRESAHRWGPSGGEAGSSE